MIRVKPDKSKIVYEKEFENLVNYDKSKTSTTLTLSVTLFENLVNYDKSKTARIMSFALVRLRTL